MLSLGECLRFQWLGSAVPAHPNPDTLVLAVVVFAYPRDAPPLFSPRCTYYALLCGDAPLLLRKQEKRKKGRKGKKRHHNPTLFFSLHPIYYPGTTLALPPSSNSDLGSYSRPFSPVPTTVRAFIFIIFMARRTQYFYPSTTRVELCVPTLRGALSS